MRTYEVHVEKVIITLDSQSPQDAVDEVVQQLADIASDWQGLTVIS